MQKQSFLFMMVGFLIVQAACSQNIQLPSPDREGGIPLMKALNERQSTREFSEKEISLQDLSDLCWAAWGYNRKDKRTAPSSMNKQEMDLYVVLSRGAYIYNARENRLDLAKKEDLRAYCGKQEFVATAPVNFIYVANLEKAGITSIKEITAEKMFPSHANSAFMAQNVYLVSASKGLGCVVRAWIDADELGKMMGLTGLQKVIIGQTIGHTK